MNTSSDYAVTYIVVTYINETGVVVSAAVALKDLQLLYAGGDEGVTWMRGYYAHDSKEVACLKVAHALAQKSPHDTFTGLNGDTDGIFEFEISYNKKIV